MKTYAGMDQDEHEGITHLGGLIRDAWIFGILPEGETCSGWTAHAMAIIYERVSQAWEQYEYATANLPPDLRKRHERIHHEAIRRALTPSEGGQNAP